MIMHKCEIDIFWSEYGRIIIRPFAPSRGLKKEDCFYEHHRLG